MAKVKPGDTVKINYTGKLKNGIIFDSSVNKDPLQFKISAGHVIPDFEQAIIGMAPADSKDIETSTNNAYDSYNEKLVIKVSRDKIPSGLNQVKGQQLRLHQPEGNDIFVNVKEINDEKITLDANHQLAGKDLFSIFNLLKSFNVVEYFFLYLLYQKYLILHFLVFSRKNSF